ncbi:hypothetical protein Syun_023519 [Stephania yunnanensis]|uniref:Uncharacterized protein n=1 Tax=Stephania yunnanensis TaxID=152371 RepID=A0AAP0FH28_9MAGN
MATQHDSSGLGTSPNTFSALPTSPTFPYPAIMAVQVTAFLSGISSNSAFAASTSPKLAYPATIAVHETTFLSPSRQTPPSPRPPSQPWRTRPPSPSTPPRLSQAFHQTPPAPHPRTPFRIHVEQRRLQDLVGEKSRMGDPGVHLLALSGG